MATRLTETDAPATHLTHDAARAHGSPVARFFRMAGAATLREVHQAPQLPRVGDKLNDLDGQHSPNALRCHAVIPVRIAGRPGEWDVVCLFRVTGPLGRAERVRAA